MNITVILAITLLIVIGFVLANFNRYLLIVLFLLPASQFLGFLDPMLFASKGVFDIHAYFGVVILLVILGSGDCWHELRDARFRGPMFVLVCFWFYGVVAPVVNDYSSLFYSIKASKEFMTIFAYYAIFFYVRTERDINWSWRILIGYGLYASLLEIVAQVFGDSLMRHTVYDYRKEFIFWKVYVPFFPVILIAMLHSYFEYALSGRRPLLRLGIAGFGLFFTFFRSYLIAVICAIPVIMLLGRYRITRVITQAVMVLILGICAVIAIAEAVGDKRYSVEALSDYFIFSGVKELADQTGGSLAGREAYAKDRRKVLEDSPFLGYGFIDKESEFGVIVRRHIPGSMLGFLDKGDLDVWLKFGYVGGIILYLTVAFLVLMLVRLVWTRPSLSIQIRALTLATTLLVFLLVQPVHAALTYSFSLLPFVISLALLEREYILFNSQQGNT